MKVYIIGAGASRSYSRSPTGILPPLSHDFFKTFSRLRIASDPHVLIGNIITYVRDTRGVKPDGFNLWQEHVEEFLAEIQNSVAVRDTFMRLDPEDGFQRARAYTEMLFLFASVLNEVQNGPICENYAYLCSRLEPGDVIVSFNWDTLFDRALWASHRWHPADGYGIAFAGVYDDGWHASAASEASDVLLLKLHGSTNWLMPYWSFSPTTGGREFANRGMEDSSSTVFCFLQSSRRYETFKNRTRDGYQPFSYYYYPPNLPVAPIAREHDKVAVAYSYDPISGEASVSYGGYPTVSMPLIVAPAKHKLYDLCGAVFHGLWERAGVALQACDEIVVVGYSFPSYDAEAWGLLTAALEHRSNPPPALTIVDPNAEEVLRRMREKLQGEISPRIYATTFAEYAMRYL